MMGTNKQSTKETGSNTQPPQHSDDTRPSMGSVKDLKENWQKWTHEHREYQEHNPFSHNTRPTAAGPQKGQDTYGRPLVGSMTEQRGKDAHTNISREVRQLCEVIRDIGEPRDTGEAGDGADDGKGMSLHFGKLFEHYVTISNKVVGILLRARRQGLVDFQGEMLWQGRDDHVVITLL